MEKTKVLISFNKRFSSEGTVYKKFIRLTIDLHLRFMNALQKERVRINSEPVPEGIINYHEGESKSYIQMKVLKEGNCIFLNLTQSAFLCAWLKIQPDIEVDLKRLANINNTAILVTLYAD